MDVLKMIGVGVAGAWMILLFREKQNAFGILLSVAVGALLVLWAWNDVKALVEGISGLMTGVGVERGFLIGILKIAGLSMAAEIAVQMIRDTGANALAAQVETVAKVAVMTMALPAMETLLGLARELLP